MKKLIVKLAIASAFSVAGATASSASNLVLNGNFSTLADWAASGTGTTPGIGISATSSPASPYGASFPDYGSASTAAYFVDDNAHTENLDQNVVLTSGQQYTLTFGVLLPTVGVNNTNGYTLTSSIAGNSLVVTSASLLPAGSWVTETETFTSTVSGAEDLDFAFNSGGTPAQDLFLTGVSLTATPLPASATLLIPVFAVFGLLWRRGTKARDSLGGFTPV